MKPSALNPLMQRPKGHVGTPVRHGLLTHYGLAAVLAFGVSLAHGQAQNVPASTSSASPQGLQPCLTLCLATLGRSRCRAMQCTVIMPAEGTVRTTSTTVCMRMVTALAVNPAAVCMPMGTVTEWERAGRPALAGCCRVWVWTKRSATVSSAYGMRRHPPCAKKARP